MSDGTNQGKSTILVIGATGAQGGGVARHLLDRGRFGVRALTRNPDSEKAKSLEEAGAEVVQGDLSDPPSLRRALDGCGGCFGVTNYWEHFGDEVQQGMNLVDAVADSDVRHFVFSTLPSVTGATGGELASPHFDVKAEMEAHARERGIPATFVHYAFYFENFLAFFPPQKQEDGSWAFGFPQGDTPLAGVAVEDGGAVVAEIFERRDEFIGENLYLVGDDIPAAEYAEVMSRISGKDVRYTYIPRETFASFDFPGAEDLANMFEFYRTKVPNRRADLERSRALHPGMRTFETWLAERKDEFTALLEG
jgi:uncharacterized protein YbjT (DUF2867 family)